MCVCAAKTECQLPVRPAGVAFGATNWSLTGSVGALWSLQVEQVTEVPSLSGSNHGFEAGMPAVGKSGVQLTQ